jgi:hypothetical protein
VCIEVLPNQGRLNQVLSSPMFHTSLAWSPVLSHVMKLPRKENKSPVPDPWQNVRRCPVGRRPLLKLEVFVLSPLHFRVASFLSEVFVLSSLHFGVVSFLIKGLCFKPLAFWGCLFFIECLCFSLEVFVLSPLHFGLSLFSSEVFILNPLHFGVASIFIRSLCFKPTTEGCDNTLSIVALAYLV